MCFNLPSPRIVHYFQHDPIDQLDAEPPPASAAERDQLPKNKNPRSFSLAATDRGLLRSESEMTRRSAPGQVIALSRTSGAGSRTSRRKAKSDAIAAATLRHVATFTPDAPRATYDRLRERLACSQYLDHTLKGTWRCRRQGCLIWANVKGAKIERQVLQRLRELDEQGELRSYRLMSLVLHIGDTPDCRPDLANKSLTRLKYITRRLSQWRHNGASATLGGMWSVEIAPSESLTGYAHPHMHLLVALRADIHEGMVINRLRQGSAAVHVLIDAIYGDIEGAARYCRYMVKGHIRSTTETPSDEHCALVDQCMHRRRAHSLWGALRRVATDPNPDNGTDNGIELDEQDNDSDNAIETAQAKRRPSATTSAAPPRAWYWSRLLSDYIHSPTIELTTQKISEIELASITDENDGGSQ